MTDGYWNRQQAVLPSSGMLKRPRTDYDMPSSGLTSGNEMHSYISRDDDHTGHRILKDTKTIGSAYDRYLQSAQLSTFTSGEVSTVGGVGLARPVGGGMPAHSLADPAVMGCPGSGGPELVPNGRGVNFGSQLPVDTVARGGQLPVDAVARGGQLPVDAVARGVQLPVDAVARGVQLPMDAVVGPGPETVPLPPDASSTLYVEGLPSDSTRREVAHIFRPFVGYREVRLVNKESKSRGGDPIILCFVDFANPACAATAMSALQGYKVDELSPESSHLRLQFSRFPGPRTGPGSRGKR